MNNDNTLAEILISVLKDDYSHVTLNSTMRKTKNNRLTSSIRTLLDKIHNQAEYNSLLHGRGWSRNHNTSLMYNGKYAMVIHKESQLNTYEFKKRVETIKTSLEKEIKAKGLYNDPIATKIN